MKKDKIRKTKSNIFFLDKQRRKEKDQRKRKETSQKLKKKLEEVLKIIPEDTDILTKLMFVDISLNQYEEAKNIGYKLYEKLKNKDVLEGLAIIERNLGNYEKAIQFLEEIVEREPTNQYIKSKIDKLKISQDENSEKTEKGCQNQYKQIADLERKIKWLAERKQKEIIANGNEKSYGEILQETYIETYRQIADSIIKENPQEIVAREKLVKALFITGRIKESEQEAQDLLQIHQEDIIAMWYMAKIHRNNNDLYGEKEYLEKVIKHSPPNTQIKAQTRLERVKSIIEKQKMQEELEKDRQENFTEETRQEWIENIRNGFIEGTVKLSTIESLIEEARKYPNFIQSLITILDIKSKITGNLSTKIDELEKYIDTTETLTPEEYNRLLREITITREEVKLEQKIENQINRKYQKEKYEDSNEQRQYMKQVITRLKENEISREELSQIVAKLETFKDRAKSIFLIAKLYEILYNKKEAQNVLIKYRNIADLTDSERKEIVELQRILEAKEKKVETSSSRREGNETR